ncbi:peptidase [Streptomyces longisporoflavus]|uniref:Clp protease N-terminal domain-containing protein n=1 Tax=Streptomyces longisporoflavus TaxID=28044 RepID=UPI00198570AA|nr:Clp protease N-terminal domain-containing protein [Streptomyces longisporoflavus]GGV55770.1 peptidase [Streptomyces longisporoflavus]
MQSRTPQGAEPGPTRAETASRLSAALASVETGARRRAMRDGDRQIDTAHLLHSLLETDPDVRAALDDGAQVVRLLGYLVQRSIGYGLQWQGTVEDSGAMPLLHAAGAGSGSGSGGKETGWSPSAAAAMEAAAERAARRGEPHALGVDLLAALAADPDCRAVEVLRRAGADARVILRRLEDDPYAGTSAD